MKKGLFLIAAGLLMLSPADFAAAQEEKGEGVRGSAAYVDVGAPEGAQAGKDTKVKRLSKEETEEMKEYVEELKAAMDSGRSAQQAMNIPPDTKAVRSAVSASNAARSVKSYNEAKRNQ